MKLLIVILYCITLPIGFAVEVHPLMICIGFFGLVCTLSSILFDYLDTLESSEDNT